MNVRLETQELINRVLEELHKEESVRRAHRLLMERYDCNPSEEKKIRLTVEVELAVEVTHGHPREVLQMLQEHLTELPLLDEERNLLACVQVMKSEIT